MKPLLTDRPTARACLMMAAIEEAEHGAASGQAREWLARAARAPRDRVWIADGIATETWAPVSPVTGRLDAFTWREPPNTLAAAPAVEPEAESAAPALVPAATRPSAPVPGSVAPSASALSSASASAAVATGPGTPVPVPTVLPAKAASAKTAGADPVSAGMAAAALPPGSADRAVRRMG